LTNRNRSVIKENIIDLINISWQGIGDSRSK